MTRESQPQLTVNEAEQHYLRVLRDWNFARSRNEQDWRAYAMIANDADTALDEFRQAVRREIRRRRSAVRLPARASYEMACYAVRCPMRGEIVRLLQFAPVGYKYCKHKDLWYYPFAAFDCPECDPASTPG